MERVSARGSDSAFLTGGGETGALIRARDWSNTPLGPIEQWSPALRTALQMVLASPFPMVLAWGPNLISLHNDAYRPLLGDKSDALGLPFFDLWPELRESVSPLFEQALAGGVCRFEDARFELLRHDRPEETFFDFALSPVRDETGAVVGVLDIAMETTRRVLAERRSTQERERQRRLFEKAPGFMAVLTGPDHVFEFTNDAYAQVAGRSEFLGRSVREVFPELEGQGFFEVLDSVYATGERFVAERVPVTFRDAPGRPERESFLDFIYEAIRDEQGRVTGIFVEGHDVTEAHRAQSVLRESEARYRQIVEGADDFAIVALDMHGIITSWNSGAERLLGYAEAEALGRHGGIFFTSEDHEAGEPDHEMSVAQDRGRAVNERWHVRKDGSRFWGSGLMMRLDQDGGGYLKMFRDRTAEHEAEAALRESERELQRMADSLPLLVSYVDRGESYRFVNRAYQDWFGWRPDQLIGRSLREVIGDAAYAVAKPNIDRVLAGEAFSFEQHMPYRVGGERWIHVDYVPRRMQAGGAVEGFYAVVQDVSERKQAEARRLALVELSDRIRDIADADDLAYAAAEIVGRTLGVTRAGYGAIDAQAETVTVARDWNAPGNASVAGTLSFRDFGTYIDALKRGEATAVADVRSDPRTAAKAATFAAVGACAFVNVPVTQQGEFVALIFVDHAEPRAWSEAEVALLREVGERTRTAMERLRVEQELRESESRYRTLFEAIDAGFCIFEVLFDEDGRASDYRFLEVNPAFERQSGLVDAVGRRIREFAPDLEEVWFERYGRVALTGKPMRIEDQAAPLGRWFDINAFRVGAPGQQRVAALFNDISARRNAEDAVRELNETLEQRVEQRTAERDRLWTLSEDMLARADYTGMMSAVSPAWTRTLGFSEAELLARPYVDFMHPDDAAVTVAALTRMGETGKPTRFENRILRADGAYESIEWTVAPEPDGVNFIAVGRDVSAERQRQAELEAAQEQLRQSQKMEAMGQFTGGVAHDFNNLLTPILGALDMLQRRGVGGEREQRLIAGALQSAEKARTLVQRLLAFARRQPLQAEAVDVGRLVYGMADLLASTTGPHIRVVVDAADDLPHAQADPHQLEMALLNLGVNARDAMPDGGVLRISARAEHVGSGHRAKLAAGEYIRLSVADTGLGMDEATLARAVEPFFSTKGIGKGTGLGLSMVHGLASQLGGALTLDSRPGVGTEVALWLPRSAAVAKEAETVPEVTASGASRGKALLVDDEELVRISTADMLVEMGYAVVEAASAEAALALVEGGLRPDVVVTDHLMPGMNGTELAAVLRARTPGLPVLIVSGYADTAGLPSDLPRLTKPFRNSDLAASLAGLGAAHRPSGKA